MLNEPETERRCSSADCDKVLVRRDGESNRGFQLRRTCSRFCAGRLAHASRKVGIEPKSCTWCGAALVPRANEDHSSFSKRITCGKSCGGHLANAAKKVPFGDKRCQACGKPLIQRPHEKREDFRRRRSCGRSCGSIQERGEYRCRTCGELIATTAFQAARRKYCSHACRNVAIGIKRTDRIWTNCCTCGAALQRTRSRFSATKRHHCSRACSNADVQQWLWILSPRPHKSGYREDLGHFVRSSWEANVCRILRFLHLEYEYEPASFPVGERHYIPDLWVPSWNCWIEVKGRRRPDADAKMEAFRSQYPDLNLILLDKGLYNTLVREFMERVPGWEFEYVPARLRGGDRRRKENRRAA